MIPGISALIRLFRGNEECRQLDAQATSLEPMAEASALELIPEGYRNCAELRMLVADYGLADERRRAEMEADILSRFERLREETMSDLVETASRMAVSRADILQLARTLDDYAQAAQSEIRAAAEESERRASALAERASELERRVGVLGAGLEQTSGLLGSKLRAIEASVAGLSKAMTIGACVLALVALLALWSLAR